MVILRVQLQVNSNEVTYVILIDTLVALIYIVLLLSASVKSIKQEPMGHIAQTQNSF